MQRFWIWAGFLVFGYFTVRFAAGYGSHWECGRYFMPRSLVAPDGRHYPDGAEIDPVTLRSIQSGHEEEYTLAGVGVLVLLLAYAYYSMVRLYRRELDIFKREFRRTNGLPPDYKL